MTHMIFTGKLAGKLLV